MVMSVLRVSKLTNCSALFMTSVWDIKFSDCTYIIPHYTLAHNNNYSTKHLSILSRYLVYLKAGKIKTGILAYYEP